MTNSSSSSSDKLEALRKREASLKAAIAAELEREQKRKARNHARLVGIVGEAMLLEAARISDFELLMKQTLKTAVTNERERQFLSQMGWM